jgi:tRNA dimethylallyltransferase
MKKKSYIAIIGTTASGKSDLALRLAAALDGELINCDSVQLYQGFDIGAAKPTADEQRAAVHHLWDIARWDQDFDARLYSDAAENAMSIVRSRGRLPIVVGGTGLYLRALWREGWHDLPKDESLRRSLDELGLEDLQQRLQNLDPARAAEIHGNDRFRLTRAIEVATLLGHSIKNLPPSESRRDEACVIRVECPRTILHERIAKRTSWMLDAGLIDEVDGLLKAGVDPECKPMQSIGYREVVLYLQGHLPRARLDEAIVIATRQYAKRQETWFRKTKADLHWDQGTDLEGLTQQLKNFF